MRRSVLLIIILTLAFNVLGQPNFKTDYYWLNGAMGNNTITGETMNLSFFAQLKQHVFGVSFTMNNEVLSNPFVNKHPDIFNHDISLLYGRRWMENFGYVAIYTGAGILIGDDRGSLRETIDHFVNRTYEYYEKKSFVAVGLPIQAEVKLTPVPWMGIGITAIGNINTKMPYAAVMLSANFGKVIQSR